MAPTAASSHRRTPATRRQQAGLLIQSPAARRAADQESMPARCSAMHMHSGWGHSLLGWYIVLAHGHTACWGTPGAVHVHTCVPDNHLFTAQPAQAYWPAARRWWAGPSVGCVTTNRHHDHDSSSQHSTAQSAKHNPWPMHTPALRTAPPRPTHTQVRYRGGQLATGGAAGSCCLPVHVCTCVPPPLA